MIQTLNIIGYIAIFIILIIFLNDCIPMFYIWYSRIHIGCWKDPEEWKKVISNVLIKWLLKIPIVPLTDNTRLTIIDKIKGNYKRIQLQHWQEAGIILGACEVLKSADIPKLKKNLYRYINKIIDPQTGNWRNEPKEIDSAILAYSLMNLPLFESINVKPALDYIANNILSMIGEDGTVPYRLNQSKLRYVDTVGFICPFLVRYGVRFNKSECIELSLRQIEKFVENGIHTELFLPIHAYHIKENIPLGIYGWGRGTGWFALGIIDTYNELPDEHPKKGLLRQIILKYTDMILKYQREDGGWPTIITMKGNPMDSSASAMLGWFLHKVSNMEGKYIEEANKSIECLMRLTRRDGVIDFSQGDTKGIGDYSRLLRVMPITQGISVRTIFNNGDN